MGKPTSDDGMVTVAARLSAELIQDLDDLIPWVQARMPLPGIHIVRSDMLRAGIIVGLQVVKEENAARKKPKKKDDGWRWI